MNNKLKWGIIGTGSIARKFAHGLTTSKTGVLAAAGSRTLESAKKFSAEFPATAHGSYEALLADPQVQAVYISTPHPLHAEWAIKAAEAGKHILCEKPIALNHAEAMVVVEAARRNDVFLMEAFMYRCHPQTAKLVELIRAKVIGDVRLIQTTFSFRGGYNLQSRLLNNALGGGGILDVGCYCTSGARLIAGAAIGKSFDEPVAFFGTGQVGAESRVDEYAIGSMKFSSGIVAQLATGTQLNLENNIRIWGTGGSIIVPSPWVITREPGFSKIIIFKNGVPEEVLVESDRDLYAYEADHVAEHLDRRQSPAMSWDDTLGNMRALDQWRKDVGVVYDSEKTDAPEAKLTVSRHPLKPDTGSPMKYGRIPGLGKQVSRLILGCDNQTTYPHAAAIYDDFFERGGNCFDTSYHYNNGIPEKLLGHWMKNRGIREQVVILGKGAHTPFCDPENLSTQLLESLERMQTDHVDIYLMHRDNPEIPAGEFIDVLNEHKKAGRIHAFGGSNWSIERVDEANAYAGKHGLTGFSAVSNNFSLARMVQPVWRGCIAASTPEARAWHERTQMPVLAWSSQARGFFTDRAHPDKRDNAELVNSWYSEDNFQRRERAIELAGKEGVLPINIALAYVLTQRFPTFALIGPRTIEETRTTMPGLEVSLTPAEVRWLNLETDSH